MVSFNVTLMDRTACLLSWALDCRLCVVFNGSKCVKYAAEEPW